MKNKLIKFVDAFAYYIISAFYFWVYILRGGVIYGFFPAAVGLVKSVQNRTEGHLPIKRFFSDTYRQYKNQKWLSFFLFFLTSLSIASMVNPVLVTGTGSGFLDIPLILVTMILWVHAIYSVYFFAEQNKKPAKWIYALAFDTSIRHPFKSLVILTTLLALSLLAIINLLVFIFFVPPLFILLTKRLIYFPDILTRT